ncbi:NAD+ synthase [Synechococcus sp. BA-124 BA4]|uniref:NAD+ synthase n=1 Tax=unclassified Synechococcus TaxID=2626047 RepID=UPI0018CCEC1A|nr:MULTISPECIES: NAD+ synthase [unclassified Synechococcus]MEA5398779.1 NAD+ synthase [Synechococcus sp. BA-124 BA4]QPN55916.1 NAD+ synthase [Synechococcus sp. CBW1107]CAK6700437.1 Glutamine-dependent NAD(+) synthetase [Synechococcus sp. CBW1107]
MRLALAQINPLVGDLRGNAAQMLEHCRRAAAAGADLVITPELSLWGYPPRDLLLRPSLLQEQGRVLEALAAELPPGLGLLLGLVDPITGRELPALHNAAALVQRDSWRVVARKRLLPSYDVFDERRYFQPGDQACLLEWPVGDRVWRLGLTICEDLWVEERVQGHRLAGADPIAELAPQRPDLLLNLSASPFAQGKPDLRLELAAAAAARLGCPVVYVNQVGGNDELVFDGGSFVIDPQARVLRQLPCAQVALELWEPSPPERPEAAPASPLPAPLEQLFRVLVLGVHDYARKCGFQRVVLGLSGGIDSALVAVIAAAALGPEQVQALLMPSPYSSAGSRLDAIDLANRLGLPHQTVAIEPLMGAFDRSLDPVLGGAPRGLTAENLQSRIRGTLLMAVANQQGRLLLSTGNKSELAVGYCTLYGDMNGGLAVIGDLYKTTVFRLCEWLDSEAAAGCRQALGLPARDELIGAAIRTKPPSAELRPDQRDTDSLPDYDQLDPLLRAYIEALLSPEELIAQGQVDGELAQRVYRLLRTAEFKRRQAAPLLKVSGRAFGGGWRMPIAAGPLT